MKDTLCDRILACAGPTSGTRSSLLTPALPVPARPATSPGKALRRPVVSLPPSCYSSILSLEHSVAARVVLRLSLRLRRAGLGCTRGKRREARMGSQQLGVVLPGAKAHTIKQQRTSL